MEPKIETEQNEEVDCLNGRISYIARAGNAYSAVWAKVITTKKLADISDDEEKTRAGQCTLFKESKVRSTFHQHAWKCEVSLEYAWSKNFIFQKLDAPYFDRKWSRMTIKHYRWAFVSACHGSLAPVHCEETVQQFCTIIYNFLSIMNKYISTISYDIMFCKIEDFIFNTRTERSFQKQDGFRWYWKFFASEKLQNMHIKRFS